MALAMKNMLMDQLTLYLTQEMTTNVTDDTRAEVTREGKLQQDPTGGTGINILIMTEDEVDPDELWTLENAEGLRAPAYEIGGGPTFYYRFRLKYTMHFRGLQGDDGRSDARARAYTVLGRSKRAVLMMPLPINPTTNSPRDDFNESVFDVQIDEHELRTSGGNNHYIWKGWMNFGYLVNNDTERFTGVLL